MLFVTIQFWSEHNSTHFWIFITCWRYCYQGRTVAQPRWPRFDLNSWGICDVQSGHLTLYNYCCVTFLLRRKSWRSGCIYQSKWSRVCYSETSISVFHFIKPPLSVVQPKFRMTEEYLEGGCRVLNEVYSWIFLDKLKKKNYETPQDIQYSCQNYNRAFPEHSSVTNWAKLLKLLWGGGVTCNKKYLYP